MCRLTEIELGNVGVGYVESCLKGWQGLSAAALHLPLPQGKAIALLPEGLSIERAQNFCVGGLEIGRQDSRWLTNHLLSLRARYPESAIIIQDTAALSGDKCIQGSDDRKFFRSGHVYYFLNSDNFWEKDVADIMYMSAGQNIIGFFVTFLINEEIVFDKEVDDTTFSFMSERIAEIFVSAYDRESFVIWASFYGPSLPARHQG